jgi:hypothetical protein
MSTQPSVDCVRQASHQSPVSNCAAFLGIRIGRLTHRRFRDDDVVLANASATARVRGVVQRNLWAIRGAMTELTMGEGKSLGIVSRTKEISAQTQRSRLRVDIDSVRLAATGDWAKPSDRGSRSFDESATV